MAAPLEPLFLPLGAQSPRERFCILHPAAPEVERRGAILHLHAFAEEMNKSRRMVAEQARAFARAGHDVLLLDLMGCGDSPGDFADATWTTWVEDAVSAATWLQARGAGPLWLWGLRAGCLVAAQAAARLTPPVHCLFWAPTPSGRQVLQQFLRLRSAADMLSGGGGGAMESLRATLAQGGAVDVAGYRVAAGLAGGLEAATLDPPTTLAASGTPGRMAWIELSTRVDATLTPVAIKACGAWEAAGHAVSRRVVNGPAFWQTTEIEQAPELIVASVDALATPHAVAP